MGLFLQDLFVDVVNMSITASYVILFVLAARLFLKRSPKIFSYSLWAVVLFRLVCPFSFSSAFSLLQMVSSDSGKITHTPSDIRIMTQPQVNTGMYGINSAVNTSLPTAVSNTHIGSNSMDTVLLVLLSIWALGIVLLILYSVISYLMLKHRLHTSILVKNNIFKSEGISSPFVLGFIKPKIYLPSALKETEQSYIIKHEQIHIKRFDYIIKLLAFLALCLHWFNPLVWLSFVLMSKDMEMSCDERVLKELGTEIKKDYSTSLLSLAVSKKMIKVSPITFGENNTKTRIKNVLNYKKPVFWVVLTAAIIVIGVSIALITNPASISTDQKDFTKKIYGYRTPYVGNNSKVVNLAKELPVPEALTYTKVQLFTDKTPYTIEITYKTTTKVQRSILETGNQGVFDQNAAIIFALIGNVEQINFILSDGNNQRLIQRTRTWANNNMAKDVWKSSDTLEGFNTLYKEIISKFITYDSLPILLNSGKKTNIQSVNDVPSVSNYEKVKSNNEVYYIYNKSGKYYVEKPYQFVNEITDETYGELHSLLVSLNHYEDIKQELSLDVKKYSVQKVLENSCILDGDGVINSSAEIVAKFVADTQNGKKSSLKIVHCEEDGYTDITKVIYDGKDYYGVVLNSKNSFTEKDNYYYEFKYKYLKTFDMSGYKLIYLLEDNNVTFGDIDKYIMSEYSPNAKNSNTQLHFHFVCAFDRK